MNILKIMEKTAEIDAETAEKYINNYKINCVAEIEK